VHGEEQLPAAHRLARALRRTAADICEGRSDGAAADQAAARLGLPPELANRYVDRLRSATEGLILQDEVDREGLRTIVELRRRYLPSEVDGVDVLSAALEDASGLIVPDAPAR
jgi:hypothetical protein